MHGQLRRLRHRALNPDFYPATGYRVSGGGGLLYVGTDGYFWCSAPGSATMVYTSYFNFSNGNVYPENGTHRANGIPVRCVQE